MLVYQAADGQYVQLLFGDSGNQTWVARIIKGQEHRLKNLTFGTRARVSQQDD